MYPSQIETLPHDNPVVLMKADYSDYIPFRKSYFYPKLFSRPRICRFLIVTASLVLLFSCKIPMGQSLPEYNRNLTNRLYKRYRRNVCGNYPGMAYPVRMHHLSRFSDLNMHILVWKYL